MKNEILKNQKEENRNQKIEYKRIEIRKNRNSERIEIRRKKCWN